MASRKAELSGARVHRIRGAKFLVGGELSFRTSQCDLEIAFKPFRRHGGGLKVPPLQHWWFEIRLAIELSQSYSSVKGVSDLSAVPGLSLIADEALEMSRSKFHDLCSSMLHHKTWVNQFHLSAETVQVRLPYRFR